MREMIIISFETPRKMEHQARVMAACQGISRSELIRRAIIDYFRKFENESGWDETKLEVFNEVKD